MSCFTLAYSSCPNDTFIFHALAHGLVKKSDMKFDITIADVETLNQHAARGDFDITKLSFATLGAIRDEYALLRTGAALGRGCGPLVIKMPGKEMESFIKGKVSENPLSSNEVAESSTVSTDSPEIKKPKIAVPGMGTTAFVLFTLFIRENFPEVTPEIIPMPFEKVMPSVQSGEADFGVIIHEGRFVYRDLGLDCLVDLGEWWERWTSLPIPLGCIAVKRETEQNRSGSAKMIEELIGESISFGFDHPEASESYIREHAQELESSVIKQHIDLYVNEFSKDIGEEGERAIRIFFQKAEEAGIIKPGKYPLFA